jgi:hypothetical protein
MNHTKTLSTAVTILAVAAAFIGVVAINNIQVHISDKDVSVTKFTFKQKLTNNCSGSAECTNDALEIFLPIE